MRENRHLMPLEEDHYPHNPVEGAIIALEGKG